MPHLSILKIIVLDRLHHVALQKGGQPFSRNFISIHLYLCVSHTHSSSDNNILLSQTTRKLIIAASFEQ